MAQFLLKSLARCILFIWIINTHQVVAESFIGVNYGLVADNLPPPATASKLLQTTTIGKVRMYGVDPGIIRALAGTGIDIFIGVDSGDIPALTNQAFANQWIAVNVLPYVPVSNITLISVGNEVLTFGDASLISQLLPAMQNLYTALASVGLEKKIKVTTVHTMAVLQQSSPPSGGQFMAAYKGIPNVMTQILWFLQVTGSPFAINPYPYFAYMGDPRPETLAFCLFQQNPGRFDPNTKITYFNMFDAQLDAIHSALVAQGFKDMEIVVAETGWPYAGASTEVGPSLENAKAYNGNLVAHLRSMVGTPLMQGKSMDTYIFALFDENLKPGSLSEKFFGLYKPDLTMNYDINITKK